MDSGPSRSRALLEGRLVGIELPATKARLLQWAREHGATGPELAALERLEARDYASPNDVGEALWPVDPADVVEPAHPGATQSGDPPGREQYVAGRDT